MLRLMTEKEALKKDIIKKFKSLSYFCILTETPYKNTLAFFCSKDDDSDRLKELRSVAKNTQVDKYHGLIRDEDRSTIRLCILSNFKNYTVFSREHNEYDTVYLSNIIGGRLSEETEKYRNLVRLLTMDYGLDIMIWYRIKKLSRLGS